MSMRAAVMVGALLIGMAGVGTAAADGPFLSRDQGQLNSTTGGCGGAARGGEAGTVWVRRVQPGRVWVSVRLDHGLPNRRYIVNVSCIGFISDFTTDAAGEAMVDFVTDYSPTTMVIDVHPATDWALDRSQSPLLNVPLVRR